MSRQEEVNHCSFPHLQYFLFLQTNNGLEQPKMSIEIRSQFKERPLVEYPITLVDLKKLVPHEMTIKEELERFKDSVLRDGAVFHPMLIDKDTMLILDGHHRHMGLLELGYRNGPAIFLNYLDDKIVTLGTWYPLVDNPPEHVKAVLLEQGLRVEEIDDLEGEFERLKTRGTTGIFGNLDVQYRIDGDRSVIFDLVRERWLDQIMYYDNKQYCLQAAKNEKTAILSWPFTKVEILEYVKKGNIHVPKTTRHVLTYRYKKCDYPLTGLARM
ncbi:MAG: hypothetical protein ACW98K_05450 [Candidatus Kariarchaeaceae archaeon]|jgi:hypothetical protein